MIYTTINFRCELKFNEIIVASRISRTENERNRNALQKRVSDQDKRIAGT